MQSTTSLQTYLGGIVLGALVRAVLAADSRGHVGERDRVGHHALVSGAAVALQELIVGLRSLGPGQLIQRERPSAPADLVLDGRVTPRFGAKARRSQSNSVHRRYAHHTLLACFGYFPKTAKQHRRERSADTQAGTPCRSWVSQVTAPPTPSPPNVTPPSAHRLQNRNDFQVHFLWMDQTYVSRLFLQLP